MIDLRLAYNDSAVVWKGRDCRSLWTREEEEVDAPRKQSCAQMERLFSGSRSAVGPSGA